MPEIKYYMVTQQRQVRVAANNPSDAILIANAAFEGKQDVDGIWGYPANHPDVTDMHVVRS